MYIRLEVLAIQSHLPARCCPGYAASPVTQTDSP
jgi:hypothetical protein